MTITTNQYQSKVVNAFAVFAKVIMATAEERAELHSAGIHVCIEMLIDGLCVSHRVPKPNERAQWERLRQTVLKIQDILWHEGYFVCKTQHSTEYDTHTYICNGIWEIRWPELDETSITTYDDGGQ